MLGDILKQYSNDWLKDSVVPGQQIQSNGRLILQDKWRDLQISVQEVDVSMLSPDEIIQHTCSELESRRSVRNVLPVLGLVCKSDKVLVWTELPDSGTLKDLIGQTGLHEWDLFMIMRDIFLALTDLSNEHDGIPQVSPINIALKKVNFGVQVYSAKLMCVGFPFNFTAPDDQFLPPHTEQDQKKYIYAWAAVYLCAITKRLPSSIDAHDRESLLKSCGVSADIRNLINSCLHLDTTSRWDYGEVMYFLGEYLKRDLARKAGLEVRGTDESSTLDTSRLWTGNHQKSFKNGDCYIGEWLEGKFHGNGIYSWLNGTSFQGQFVAGMPHGMGSFTFAEGNSYEGSLENGQMEGEGVYTFSNRDMYRGQFQQDYLWGSGTLIMSGPNNVKYDGSFMYDKFQGHGTITKQGNLVYKGELKYGMYHGSGTKHYSNGDCYQGSFLLGFKHGYGIYYFANGDKFEGYYAWGKKDGEGKFTFSNGNFYQGGFSKGLKSGIGELYIQDKLHYKGQFASDKYDGSGYLEYLRPNSVDMSREQASLVVPVGEEFNWKYEGQFKSGKKSGHGSIRYSNGAIYTGDFLEDLRYGTGTYAGSDGSSYHSSWDSDLPHGQGTKVDSLTNSMTGQFTYGRMTGIFNITHRNGDLYTGDIVKELREGKGFMKYVNGAVYNGEWKNNAFEGEGEFTAADGVKSTGEWRNGKRHGSIITNWPDGKRFEGQYEDDKKHGLGIYYMPDGKVIKKSY